MNTNQWLTSIGITLMIAGAGLWVYKWSAQKEAEDAELKVLGSFRNSYSEAMDYERARQSEKPDLKPDEIARLTMGALAGHQEAGLRAFSNGSFRDAAKSFEIVIRLIEERAPLFDLTEADIMKHIPTVQEWLRTHTGTLTGRHVEELRARIGDLKMEFKENLYFEEVQRVYLDAYLMLTIASSVASQ